MLFSDCRLLDTDGLWVFIYQTSFELRRPVCSTYYNVTFCLDILRRLGLRRNLDFYSPVFLSSGLGVVGCYRHGFAKPDNFKAAVGYTALNQ